MALVIKNNVKKCTDFNVSGEFLVELEKKVEEIIKKAEERAKENGRRTIFKRDV